MASLSASYSSRIPPAQNCRHPHINRTMQRQPIQAYPVLPLPTPTHLRPQSCCAVHGSLRCVADQITKDIYSAGNAACANILKTCNENCQRNHRSIQEMRKYLEAVIQHQIKAPLDELIKSGLSETAQQHSQDIQRLQKTVEACLQSFTRQTNLSFHQRMGRLENVATNNHSTGQAKLTSSLEAWKTELRELVEANQSQTAVSLESAASQRDQSFDQRMSRLEDIVTNGHSTGQAKLTSSLEKRIAKLQELLEVRHSQTTEHRSQNWDDLKSSLQEYFTSTASQSTRFVNLSLDDPPKISSTNSPIIQPVTESCPEVQTPRPRELIRTRQRRNLMTSSAMQQARRGSTTARTSCKGKRSSPFPSRTNEWQSAVKAKSVFNLLRPGLV